MLVLWKYKRHTSDRYKYLHHTHLHIATHYLKNKFIEYRVIYAEYVKISSVYLEEGGRLYKYIQQTHF